MGDVGGAVSKRTSSQAFLVTPKQPRKPPSGEPFRHLTRYQTGFCRDLATLCGITLQIFATLLGYQKCTAQGALFHI